jgi:hypothetical protein
MEGFAVSPLRNVPLALQSVRRTVLPTDSLWQLIFLRSVFSSFPLSAIHIHQTLSARIG